MGHRLKRRRRIQILGRVTLASFGLVLLKAVFHHYQWECITISPLFSALVASDVFLLGFLLNGVLTDYKESERLPGELAAALLCLGREVHAVPLHAPEANVDDDLIAVRDFGRGLGGWLRNELGTDQLMAMYEQAHLHVVQASTWLTHSSLKGRLMIEMAAILRAIYRIDVIRETDFVEMAYWLAYMATTILCAGLVLARSLATLEPYFFLFVISFLLLFILHLISDLDNPFGYGDRRSAEDVSLDVIEAAQERLEQMCATAAGAPMDRQLRPGVSR